MNTRRKEKRGFYASLPQIGLSIGLCLSAGVVGADVEHADRGRIPGLGLARRLHRQHRSGARRPLHPPAHPGDARVRTACGRRRPRSHFHSSRCCGCIPENILLGMGARYIDGVFFNIFAVFSIGYLPTR